MNYKRLGILFAVVTPVFWLAGCVDEKMPDEVTREFWQAVGQQDATLAMHYVSQKDGQIQLDLSHGRWPGLQASVGEIRINQNRAEVDTYLLFKGESDTIQAETFLLRESGQWLIDYPMTIAALPVNQNQGLLNKWQAMGKRFSNEMDRAFGDIQQEIPKIEQSFEQFGNTLKDDVENAWREKIPEIKQELDSFVEEFERALDEAGKAIEKRRQELDENNPQDQNGKYI